MTKLAILSDVHLLPEAEAKIGDLFGAALDFPHEPTQPDLKMLVRRTGQATAVLISPGTSLGEAYSKACPQVSFVGVCGTSMETIDTRAAAEQGVTIANVTDYGDEPTAEFIFLQLASLARGMGAYQWKKYPVELLGKSIAIMGMEALGMAVAHLALAYKMKVSYWSRTRKEAEEMLGIQYKQVADLLAQADIVVMCGATNVQLMQAAEFRIFTGNKILVQGSSGTVFEKSAFLNWIAQDNNFAIFDYAAGKDNYDAFKDLPNVTFPQVIAGHSYETKERLGVKVIEYLKQLLAAAS